MKRYITILFVLAVAVPMSFVSVDAVIGDDYTRKQVGTPFESSVNMELQDNNIGTADKKKSSIGLYDQTLKSLSDKAKSESRPAYVQGEVIVKFKESRLDLEQADGVTKSRTFAVGKKMTVKENIRRANIAVYKTSGTETVEQKVAELKKDPAVEYVEPNYKRYPSAINTNDTYKNNLWGLDNTGQTVNGVTGSNNKDIDAPEAWVIHEGTNSTVIVAVIDSGIAYNHPDLLPNMWNGATCKDENGAAIAGGCNHGYDYEDSDNTPIPTSSSHGTHIAGTIAAAKNNGFGIIGVAPQAKIMALKFGLDIVSEIKAIDFAIQNGSKIINASFGNSFFSQSEYDAINRFRVAGGIFVVAAGNGGSDLVGDNNEDAHNYPSDYNLDNIISVAATDQNDDLASFSDFGAISVDVSAPGTNIYSTVPQETTSLFETFESLIPPASPSGWVKGGTSNNWGTYTLDNGSFFGNVLYGDVNNFPYAQTANTTITSSTYNLSAGGANIDFWASCDTEYSTTSWTDYMDLEYSADGVNFSPATDPYFGGEFRWDEPIFDILNSESPLDSASGALFHYKNISIPDQFLTSNFKFRFRWVANGNADTGNGDGCLVDDVKITKFSNGSDEQYGYNSGTSMATPHVAGLAALIWGYKPELTLAEVKSTILDTGDTVTDLVGKTVSGKRINAFNALDSLAPQTHTISGTIKYYDGIETVPNATVTLETDAGAQVATTTTDINGAYQFTDVAPGGNYVVKVSKSDTASGLTSADRILIGRHIVGLESLNSIYKIIAGDVNDSGTLSSADRILIGRFIVGLDSNLLSGVWRFYPSDSIMNATNYLTTNKNRNYLNISADLINQDFVGIKMGDVNNSWVNN